MCTTVRKCFIVSLIIIIGLIPLTLILWYLGSLFYYEFGTIIKKSVTDKEWADLFLDNLTPIIDDDGKKKYLLTCYTPYLSLGFKSIEVADCDKAKKIVNENVYYASVNKAFQNVYEKVKYIVLVIVCILGFTASLTISWSIKECFFGRGFSVLSCCSMFRGKLKKGKHNSDRTHTGKVKKHGRRERVVKLL